MIGDNYALSADSRHFRAYPGRRDGVIPRDQIVGVASMRYWPPGRWGRLERPATTQRSRP